MFAKLALRNIWKHGKRSSVVFAAVAVAVCILCIVAGSVRGLSDTVLSSIIPTAGHLVITEAASKNAANPLDLKFLIPDSEKVLAVLADDRIAVAEAVLTLPALLVEPVPIEAKTEARSLGLLGQGVSPDTKFLTNVRAGITAGAFLPGGRGVALSNRAAKLLGVSLGGSVMVLTTDRNSNPWYEELPITGLFNSGSEQVDLNLFVVSEATARNLVDAEGMSREIRVLLKDPDTAYALAADLGAKLGNSLRILPWQENFAAVLTIIKLLDVLFWLIRFFFVIVAGSVITNSILMTVFERTREYGTLRAIGLKKRHLRAMILTEGAFLGVMGSVAGLVVGIPVVLLLSRIGLDLGSATEYVGFASRIYPQFAPVDAAANLLFGTLIAVVASAYASRVSSRLSVNQLLSHA